MLFEKNFKKFEDENISLLINKKESLSEQLKLINERLKNSSNIDEFLRKQQYEILIEKVDSIKCKDNCLVRFMIKFIGTFFVTLYLIGVFEIIGIMKAVQDELLYSVKMYLSHEIIENRTNFYNNYINIATQIPSFSPFFLSSILSEIIINLIGMYFTTLIVIIINILTLFFGLSNFTFHQGNLLEENYTLKEFLTLLVMYLMFYLSIGLVALAPINIIQEGFKEYDRHKSIRVYKDYHNFTAKVYAHIHLQELEFDDYKEAFDEEKKKLEGCIEEKEKNSKKEILNKKKDELNNSAKFFKDFFLEYKNTINGFLFFYIFSMSISSICVIIMNRIYLVDLRDENINTAIWLIILFFTASMFFSLFFYFLYSLIFLNDKTKSKKEIDIKKFGGYIIYQESSKSDKGCLSSCKSDCIECIKKLNYGCCCQLCSCSFICKSIFCCNCSCDNNERKLIKTSDTETTKICIIYRINGICSWAINLLIDPRTIIFVPFLYLFYALNIGFSSTTSDDFDKDITKKSILNVIILISRFILYGINYFGGKILNKCLDDHETDKDFYNILYGLILVIMSESLFSAIISILIFFNLLMDDIKEFFVVVSHKSTEYIEIVCLEYFSFYFKVNNPIGEFLSNSSILTLYLFLWKAIELLIIDIIKVKNEILLFFKFIFGIILPIILFAFIIYLKKHPKADESILNFIYKLDNEQ